MNKYQLKELKIEVTYQCPLACIHCSSNAGKDSALSLPVEKCFSIILEAAKMGVRQIAFSGGEPLIWPHIIDCIKLCQEHNIETSIYTSGNCKDIEDTFSKLANAGLSKAIFSIYSSEEIEHIRITRIRDSYQNTLRSIAACTAYGIVPEIHFVAMASNYYRLPDIVKLAKENNVCCVSVLRFVPQGRGVMIKNHDTLSRAQNQELVKMILDIRGTGFVIRTGSPFNVLLLNENPSCMAARDRLIIAPDLSIYPCDAFKQIEASRIASNRSFCSVRSDSLEECWSQSTYLNAVRAAIAAPPKEPCKSCPKYDHCRSGCLAQKFLAYDSLEQRPDPACMNRSSI